MTGYTGPAGNRAFCDHRIVQRGLWAWIENRSIRADAHSSIPLFRLGRPTIASYMVPEVLIRPLQGQIYQREEGDGLKDLG